MYAVIEVNSREEAREIVNLINKAASTAKAEVFGNPDDGWCVQIVSGDAKII